MKKPPDSSKAEAIRGHYEPRISPRREHFDVLDWASAFSQERRFDVLVRHVELAGRSLLDVGCGLGDLLGYLLRRGIDTEYTGVDISKKMLQAARRNHPDGRFVCADVFADEPRGGPLGETGFDVVFCSGVFNLNLGNNRQFAARAIPRLCLLARQAAAFNMLHKRAAASDPAYFYFDPDEVLPLVPAAGWRAQLIDDYLPNDFTILCRRTGPE
ncbi:MAG TPA: class I SAM-dependent methyltransferase [Phycisphaerae bacterium]|nr:class I SAM-dependent methyltransferase [Phycisphaerae bacterium]